MRANSRAEHNIMLTGPQHDAVRSALDDAGLEINQIDGIAFTRGPGMRSCLAVGANAAKTLACVMRKPLVGVHHMVTWHYFSDIIRSLMSSPSKRTYSRRILLPRRLQHFRFWLFL